MNMTSEQLNTLHYVNWMAEQAGEQLDTRILALAAVNTEREYLYRLSRNIVIDSGLLFGIADQLYRWSHCPNVLGKILTEPVFTSYVVSMWTKAQRSIRQRKSELKHKHKRTSFRSVDLSPARRQDLLNICTETIQTLMFDSCWPITLCAPVHVRDSEFVRAGYVTEAVCHEITDSRGRVYKTRLGENGVQFLRELASINRDKKPDELTYIIVRFDEVWYEIGAGGNICSYDEPIRFIVSARRPTENRQPVYNTLVSATLATVYNLPRIERSQATLEKVDDRSNVWNIESYHQENNRLLDEIENWLDERSGTFRSTLFGVERRMAGESYLERLHRFESEIGYRIAERTYFRERERLFKFVKQNIPSEIILPE